MYYLECSCDEEFWYVMFSDNDIDHINKLYILAMKKYPFLYFRIVKVIKKQNNML